MALLLRIIAPGMPHHVTQRGHRRERVFLEYDDYALYRNWLARTCRSNGVGEKGPGSINLERKLRLVEILAGSWLVALAQLAPLPRHRFNFPVEAEKGPGSIFGRLRTPRRARIHIDGLPLHVVRRRHNRAPCFFDDQTWLAFLGWLREAVAREHCRLHAYVLMTN